MLFSLVLLKMFVRVSEEVVLEWKWDIVFGEMEMHMCIPQIYLYID